MKNLILILFLNISYVNVAQQSFKFDMLLIYETSFTNKDQTTSTEIRYILTNSRDNSYTLRLKSKDSLSFKAKFIEQDQLFSEFVINKANFHANKTLNLKCDLVYNLKNNYKNKAKQYSFTAVNDTIIDSKSYKYYKTNYLKSEKKRLKHHIGQSIYIIENNTNYHLPIFEHKTMFERWKLTKNVPNGIYKEYIFINYLGEIVNHFKLKNIEKVNYTLNTEKPCPPTMTIPRR